MQYPGLHPLMERYARLAMRQYEQYTNLSDEQCALPGSFAVFALGMLEKKWRQLIWDYLDLCDDEHSHLQEKFLREYVKQFGFTADTVPVFVRGVLSMQNMKYSKDYTAWMANAESLGALLEAKIHLSEIVPSGFSSDEDDDEDDDEDEHEHHHHDHDDDDHDCCHHHDDEDEHEHHHEHHYDEHGVCSCGHHHHHDHDADEVFTSWGKETAHKYSREDLDKALHALDEGAYGMILRAKGIVDGGDTWYEFDMVPGEHEIRTCGPDVTGKLCVIGSQLKEHEIAELFHV